MSESFVNYWKITLFRKTNTIPFMLGLLIGLSYVNADLIFNLGLTIGSGTAYHTIKSIVTNIVT